jgi:integrase
VAKHRNDGLRKVCGCARKSWTKCPHPWHFAFQWQGTHHRYSLDRLLGKRIESKTDAETEAERLRVAIKDGTFRKQGEAEPVTRETLTLAGLLTLYRERALSTRSETTRTAFDHAVRVITRTPVPGLDGRALPFGEWRAADVTTEALEQFRDVRKPHGTTGANRLLGHLSTVFAWAASNKRRLINDNPFRDGDQSAVARFEERARTRRLQPGEGERLLAACGDHLRGVVECALETGMRRGEILSLQWHQVRWSPKAQILLPASKTKTKRDRVIPMSSRLKAILEMRRTDPKGDDHPPEAYVFGTATGERILTFKRAWQTAVLKAHGHTPTFVTTKVAKPRAEGAKPGKATNLSPACRATLQAIDLHFHDLRREAGSRWLDAGLPLHQVQAWLGHTNISQTSTYLAVTDTGADEAMAKFDRLRGEGAKPSEPEASENLQTTCKEDGEKWSGREDSNLRPLGPEPSALPG